MANDWVFQLGGDANGLTRAAKEGIGAIAGLEKSVAHFGKSFAGMGGRLNKELGSALTAGLGNVGSLFGRMGSTALTGIVGIGKSLGGALLGGIETAFKGLKWGTLLGLGTAASGGAALAKLAYDAGNISDALMSVRIQAGLGADEMDRYREIAVNFGSSGKFGILDVAGAMKILAREGYGAADQMNLMVDAANNLAHAKDAGLAESAVMIDQIRKAFDLPTDVAADIADVFANTTIPVGELGSALANVAPVATSAGQSLTTVATLLERMDDLGIDASTSSMSLRMAMANLLNPTTEVEKRLAKLGIAYKDVNPQTNNFIDVLKRLQKAGATTADALEIFGTRGGAPVAKLLKSGLADIDKYTLALLRTGTAAELTKLRMDTLRGDVDNLGGAWAQLEDALGAPLEGAFRPLVQAIDAGLRSWAEYVKEGDKIGKVLAWLREEWATIWDSAPVQAVRDYIGGITLDGLREQWDAFKSDLTGDTATRFVDVLKSGLVNVADGFVGMILDAGPAIASLYGRVFQAAIMDLYDKARINLAELQNWASGGRDPEKLGIARGQWLGETGKNLLKSSPIAMALGYRPEAQADINARYNERFNKLDPRWGARNIAGLTGEAEDRQDAISEAARADAERVKEALRRGRQNIFSGASSTATDVANVLGSSESARTARDIVARGARNRESGHEIGHPQVLHESPFRESRFRKQPPMQPEWIRRDLENKQRRERALENNQPQEPAKIETLVPSPRLENIRGGEAVGYLRSMSSDMRAVKETLQSQKAETGGMGE